MTAEAPPQANPPRVPAAHVKNPTLARALFAMMAGDRAVVVDSPPGAGKTHLITNLAQQLHDRAGMTVAIAAQTRAQALDVANRTAETGAAVSLLVKHKSVRPPGLSPDVTLVSQGRLRPGLGIVVATTARWLWTPTHTFRTDALLVDEAYQLTYADLGGLGTLADQVTLVGDPGQIDPVVTGETRRWDGWAAGPHQPSPSALLASDSDGHVTSLRLPKTWRLGPATTDLIRPLYSIPFESARPPSHVEDSTGPLPEYCVQHVTVTGGQADPAIALAAATRVRARLASGSVHTLDGARPLTARDVAVVAPHVEQTTMLAAALADQPDVFVGTINQAQGLERHAVVAVHPLAGYATVSPFATDLGRTCVALSRHRSHLTVVADDRTSAVLARTLRDHPEDTATRTQQHLLDTLTNQGARP